MFKAGGECMHACMDGWKVSFASLDVLDLLFNFRGEQVDTVPLWR